MPIFFGVLGVISVVCIGAFKIAVDTDISIEWRHIFERPWPMIVILIIILIAALDVLGKYVQQRRIGRKITKSVEEFKTKQHKELITNAARKLAKKLQAKNQGYAEAKRLLKMVGVGLACCLDFVDDISPILKRYVYKHGVKVSYIDEENQITKNLAEYWGGKVKGGTLKIQWPLKTTRASREIEIW